MTAAASVAELRDALGAGSSADGGAVARLTRALEEIGWRGGDALEPGEVAEELLPAVTSCAREHGEMATMYRQIAEVLRASGPVLDGSLPPLHDYLPAAAELVRRFIAAAA